VERVHDAAMIEQHPSDDGVETNQETPQGH
jgi:hypothetical protein